MQCEQTAWNWRPGSDYFDRALPLNKLKISHKGFLSWMLSSGSEVAEWQAHFGQISFLGLVRFQEKQFVQRRSYSLISSCFGLCC